MGMLEDYGNVFVSGIIIALFILPIPYIGSNIQGGIFEKTFWAALLLIFVREAWIQYKRIMKEQI